MSCVATLLRLSLWCNIASLIAVDVASSLRSLLPTLLRLSKSLNNREKNFLFIHPTDSFPLTVNAT